MTNRTSLTDKRNYKVSGKKLLPKPCNLRRNQAKKLGRSLQRAGIGS